MRDRLRRNGIHPIYILRVFNWRNHHVKEQRLQSYVARKPSPLRRGGVSRIRTGDPLLAKQVLYQLSYNPFRLRISDFGFRIGCVMQSIRILKSAFRNAEGWGWEELNLRPHAYQACALTT